MITMKRIHQMRHPNTPFTLIAALADTPDTPVVTDDVLDWSCRYVEHYLRQTLEVMRGRIADSDVQRMRNEMLQAIRDAGPRGVTETEMHRSPIFTRYSKRDRADAIDSLTRAHLIAEQLVGHGSGPGRPRRALVAIDPDQVDLAS